MKHCTQCGNDKDPGWAIACTNCLHQYDKIVLAEDKHEPMKDVCYDCLKTRGFVISAPLITIAATLAIALIFGHYDPKWYIFGIGWGIAFVLIILTTYGAFWCIREYCTVKSDDYKNPPAIIMFSIFTFIVICALALCIEHMPANYEYFVKHDLGNWI